MGIYTVVWMLTMVQLNALSILGEESIPLRPVLGQGGSVLDVAGGQEGLICQRQTSVASPTRLILDKDREDMLHVLCVYICV